MNVRNESTLLEWLNNAKYWRCPGCGKTMDTAFDGSARWNGVAWEHRCEGIHAQAGHVLCEVVHPYTVSAPASGGAG